MYLPDILKIVFDAPYFQNIIVKSATGTAQKGFYLNQLENVLICIPPLAEQDKISCGISSIFYYLDLIEKASTEALFYQVQCMITLSDLRYN